MAGSLITVQATLHPNTVRTRNPDALYSMHDIIGIPQEASLFATFVAIRVSDQAAFRAAGWKEGDVRVSRLVATAGAVVDIYLLPDTNSNSDISKAIDRVQPRWGTSFAVQPDQTPTVWGIDLDPNARSTSFYSMPELSAVYRPGEYLPAGDETEYWQQTYISGDDLPFNPPDLEGAVNQAWFVRGSDTSDFPKEYLRAAAGPYAGITLNGRPVNDLTVIWGNDFTFSRTITAGDIIWNIAEPLDFGGIVPYVDGRLSAILYMGPQEPPSTPDRFNISRLDVSAATTLINAAWQGNPCASGTWKSEHFNNSDPITYEVPSSSFGTRFDWVCSSPAFTPIYTPGEPIVAWSTVYTPGAEIDYVATFRRVYTPGVGISYVTQWRPVYTPGENVAYVTEWRPVYQVGSTLPYVSTFRVVYQVGSPVGRVPIFQVVYTPGEVVAYEATFRPVYTPGAFLPTWQVVYTPGAGLDDFFHVVYTPGEALNYVAQFRVVYAPGVALAYVSGFKVVYVIGDRIEPDDPDFPFLPGDLDLGSGITFADLLQFNWRVGRSDAAFLARSLPGQGQIILDNTHGRYGPGNFLPGNRIRIRIPGELEIGAAFISSVRPQTNHTTGLKTSIIHIEGALAQLTRSEFEIALFETDSVRTSDIVESALDQADWSQDLRRIDKGQVRIHPAHYTSILGSRALGKTQPVLRAVEEAEVGFIHELRGSHVVFEDRYHRELDDRTAVTTFGGSATDDTIMDIEGVVNPHDEWENVYTGVAIGMERATILSPGKVWEMRPESSILGLISLGGHGTTIVVPADTTITFKVDLINQEDFRFRERVQSVASWLPIQQSHYEAHRDTDPNANVTNLVFGDVTGQTFRTSRTITIRNPNPAFGVVITRLEIHGRGVGLLGDIALPLIEDEQAELLYHRRILSLAPSVVGDGLNHGGSGLAEGKDYAETLLERYKRPRAASRLVFNPLANNETKRIGQHLQISDPVIVQGGYGLDAGEYHVEGMDFQYTASDGILEMGVFLSERGRRAAIVDQTFTPLPGPQSQWAIVHTGASGALTVPMEADRSYVIGVMAQLPSAAVPMEDDDELLRLVVGTEVRKVWKAIDLPKGEPDWLAGLIRPEEAATATMQLRTEAGITPIVSRLRAVRVDG